MVCNRLIQYINAKYILHQRQLDFRENHSTFMAIIEFLHEISQAKYNHKYTIDIELLLICPRHFILLIIIYF